MKVLLFAVPQIGATIFDLLKHSPGIQVDWYQGLHQTDDDFFLGGDIQLCYPVLGGRASPQPVNLNEYDLAIVLEGNQNDGSSSLVGDLRSYQIGGFLGGRAMVCIGASDSSECRSWFIDYGATRTMNVNSLIFDLSGILAWAESVAAERRSSETIKGLTLWQPWAWAVVNGKDVENRLWTTPYRGLVAFHSSAPAFQPRGAYEGSCLGLRAVLDSIGKTDLVIPAYEELPKGVFVAVGRITDCRPYIESPWYDPLYSQCFQIADLKVLPKPIPGPTRPLLFDLEPATLQAIREQL